MNFGLCTRPKLFRHRTIKINWRRILRLSTLTLRSPEKEKEKKEGRQPIIRRELTPRMRIFPSEDLTWRRCLLLMATGASVSEFDPGWRISDHNVYYAG